MTQLRVFWSRLRGLARREALDRDLQEQIDAHLEEAIEDFQHRGLSLDEARREALRRFGSVMQTHERHRDLRSFPWLEDARRDVRYALRALLRTPGFSTTAIIALALAIGVATAIFSVVDAALIRPVPYDKPEEIVLVDVGERGRSASAADVDAWRTSAGVFSHIGFGRPAGGVPIIVDAGTPERVTVGTLSEGLLDVFGIVPVLGRGITADDRRRGSPRVVLLGHRYWQTRFNGTPDILGRSLSVDRDHATIVGVLPASFYPETMVWRPHLVAPPMQAMRGTGVPVYARLRPGLDADAAARELTARLSSTQAADAKTPMQARVTSLYESTTSRYGRTLAILAGAVMLIVLIACVNVAGLLLARGATRQPELAVRKSLGASRSRLFRQLLVESAVLALIGGFAGVFLAFLTLDVIVDLIPLRLPENVTPAINIQVLAFSLAICIVTAVVFGLAPALKLSKTSPSTHAVAGRLRHGSALSGRGGQLLIAAEIAMALVLVAGAAVMIRSFSRIVSIDVGFEPDAIVTMDVVPVDGDPVAHEAYYRALLDSVRQLPGIAAAGGADRPPLDGSGSYTSATVGTREITVAYRSVMPGYFEAVGLRLRDGRLPTDADYTAGPPFAVLSESAARALFADRRAIGQQFTLRDTTWTVVGVVGDARNKSPLPDDRGWSDLYLARQLGERSPFGTSLTIVVRPSGRLPDVADRLRRAAESIGPAVIVERVRSGRDWFSDQVATPRQRTALLALLGGLGLLLALVGIFGTTAYAVARRTQEVGIRMALGAQPGQMVGVIVRDAALPVAFGIAVGTVGAAAVSRVIESFLFQTDPRDPLSLAATIVALAATALMAAWIPARRAAHIDPVTTLRAA